MNFYDNPSRGSRVIPCGRMDRQTDRQTDTQAGRQTDRQTDRYDKANISRNFGNAPKNEL